MCFNAAYTERRAKRYAERYQHVVQPDLALKTLPEELPQYYFVSGFSHPALPVVTSSSIYMYEWGLIPYWIKDDAGARDIRGKTLNAVGETVFEKPTFRKSLLSRRCLLGLTGFYEWREFQKVKYPYLIQVKSQEIFSLGCIYDSWVDTSTGEIRNTFSILTTPANPLMEKIHNVKKRMPLILREEDEARWVDPNLKMDVIQALIRPYDQNDMTAYTISRVASNARADRNRPEILQPVEYPELVFAD